MQGCPGSWLAVGLWGVSAVTGAVLFIRDQTEPAPDGRLAVVLTGEESRLVAVDMRGLLSATQGVLKGALAGDHGAIQEAARVGGSERMPPLPLSLMIKLPAEYRAQAMAVHTAFDDIAAASAAGETSAGLLARLDRQLARCVGCHDAFRVR